MSGKSYGAGAAGVVSGAAAVLVVVCFGAGAGAAPPIPGAGKAGPSYQLRRTPDGGFTHQASRWRAVVRPDGSVAFEERRAQTSLHLVPPVPKNRYFNQSDLVRVLRSVRDPLGRNPMLKLLTPPPSPPGMSVYRRLPNADTCILPDGTNICDCDGGGAGLSREQAAGCDLPATITVHTTLDFTDEYLRSRGEDPLAQEKAAFLTATFDLRMALARRTHAAAIERAADEIPRAAGGHLGGRAVDGPGKTPPPVRDLAGRNPARPRR